MKTKTDTRIKETEIGSIPEDWDVVNFGNLLTLEYGKALKEDQRISGNIPVFGSNGITGYHSKKLVNGPGIIVGRKGSAGEVIFSEDDFFPIDTTFYVATNYNIKFIFYLLKSSSLKQLVGSSAVPGLNRNDLYSKKVAIPKDQKEQNKIAEILSSLDKKIELNHKISENLEKLVSAMFKKWFIDIGDKLPKGWRYSTVGKELETFLGGTPSRAKKEYWTDGTIPWINSGKVNEFRITKASEYITNKALNNSATKLLPKGTVVIAITGATLGQYSLLEIDSSFNQSVVGIKEGKLLKKEFIYFWIATTIKELINAQTGGAQQHINKQVVDSHKILVPDQEILNRFYEISTPIFGLISKNCFENENLIEIRDSLLPKLMNGKIRV